MTASPETGHRAVPEVGTPPARDRSTIAARLIILALLGSQFSYLVMSLLFPGEQDRFESVGVSPEFIMGAVFLVATFLLYAQKGCPIRIHRRADFSLFMLTLACVMMAIGIVYCHSSPRLLMTIATFFLYYLAARFLTMYHMPMIATGLRNLWWIVTPAFLALLLCFQLAGRFSYVTADATGFQQPQIEGGIRSTEIALFAGLQIIYLIYCLGVSHKRWQRLAILAFTVSLCLLLVWLQSVAAVGGVILVFFGYLILVGRHRAAVAALSLFVTLALTVVLVSNASHLGRFRGILDRVISEKRQDLLGGYGKRAITNSSLINLATEHPLFGIGWGEFARNSYMVDYLGRGIYPHNNILGIAAENGLPAAAFYTFFVLFILGSGIAPFLARENPRNKYGGQHVKLFEFMAFACFAYFQWRGLFQDTWRFKELYLWAGVASGCAIWRADNRRVREDLPMPNNVDRTEHTGVRRVAVVVPIGTLDHHPGVLNAVTCFVDAGYNVDIFALRNVHYPPCHFESDRVHVRYLPVTFRSRRESRASATLFFAIWLPFVLRGPYTAVYASGVRALLSTWCASWFRDIRIINHQLELYIGAKLNTRFARIFKWCERRAIRRSFVSLEHDEMRARMLCDDAGIGRQAIEIVPNAPCGQGQVRRSRFLAERLGLPRDARLLVAAGSLSPAFMSEETVVAAQDIPPGWICVLHSAKPTGENDPYVAAMKAADRQRRVVFSLEPVPYENVADILSSADIGLALYGSVGGPNTTEVGLASGKLCHFLQHGVPVIVSDFPVLREFVLKHRVGVPLADLAGLPQAIATIMDDYEGYCRRAAETFTRELAFQTHFQRVLDRLAHAPDSG